MQVSSLTKKLITEEGHPEKHAGTSRTKNEQQR